MVVSRRFREALRKEVRRLVEAPRLSRRNIKKAFAGQAVQIVVATKSWPGLGITPDKPVFALKTMTGLLLASGRKKQELFSLARRYGWKVTDKTR